MLRILLLTFCAAMIAIQPSVGQEPQTTTWKGTLDANGTKLRLEIDFTENAGGFSGELRSLDQGNALLENSRYQFRR